MRIKKSHLLFTLGFLVILGISIGLIFGIGFESRPEPTSQPTPRPGKWKQLGDDIDGEAAGDGAGQSVSLSSDGTIVAIGGNLNHVGYRSGHVRVYEYDPSSGWLQLGDDIDGEAAEDQAGWSVALSSDGTIVAIGGNTNHVRVYEYDSSSGWQQLGSDIDGEAAGDWAGDSVSLSADGTIVAIGAGGNDGINGQYSGHVRVYEYDSSSGWQQLGDDIDGEAEFDHSGESVSLSSDGTVVAIGAIGNDGINGYRSGHVRVYEYDPSSGWLQLGDDIDGEAANDNSGHSVSLSSDGKTVAIGADQNAGNGDRRSGHVRVYEYDTPSSGWQQLGSDIDGEAAYDYSGDSVSLSSDGKTVAIGAIYNDDPSSGHVRVYEYDLSSLSWKQPGDDIDGEAAYDSSGTAVSLSADGMTVAIGAPYNDGNGDDSGHVRVYAYHSS